MELATLLAFSGRKKLLARMKPVRALFLTMREIPEELQDDFELVTFADPFVLKKKEDKERLDKKKVQAGKEKEQKEQEAFGKKTRGDRYYELLISQPRSTLGGGEALQQSFAQRAISKAVCIARRVGAPVRTLVQRVASIPASSKRMNGAGESAGEAVSAFAFDLDALASSSLRKQGCKKELVWYINKALGEGNNYDAIRSALLQAKWNATMIDGHFSRMKKEVIRLERFIRDGLIVNISAQRLLSEIKKKGYATELGQRIMKLTQQDLEQVERYLVRALAQKRSDNQLVLALSNIGWEDQESEQLLRSAKVKYEKTRTYLDILVSRGYRVSEMTTALSNNGFDPEVVRYYLEEKKEERR